jgi:nitrogenase molybdenum-iron protein alpha chain
MVFTTGEEVELSLYMEMIGLSQTTCPNREERTKGINIFYGKASELIEQAKSGCLKNHERGFA